MKKVGLTMKYEEANFRKRFLSLPVVPFFHKVKNWD